MDKSKIAAYIGAKIKERRELADIKQGELGELLGLSRVSVLNMESGRHRVSVDNLFLLCGIFKCQLNDLFPPIKTVDIVFVTKKVKVEKRIRRIKIIK